MSQTLRLYIIRHAKSSWAQVNQGDFHRPLNPRGKKDLPTMANLLKEKGIKPDKILHSSAKRTAETAHGIISKIATEKTFIEARDDMYGADYKKIVEILNTQDHQHQCILYIGHNPGVTDVVNHLCGAAISNIPTLGICEINFEFTQWDLLFKDTGTLASFHYPKQFSFD